MNVTKLTEVHIHDASSYVREALEGTGYKISTNVRSGGWLDITARKHGTLDGYSASVEITSNNLARAPELKIAVDAIYKAIRGFKGDGITDNTAALRSAVDVVVTDEMRAAGAVKVNKDGTCIITPRTEAEYLALDELIRKSRAA